MWLTNAHDGIRGWIISRDFGICDKTDSIFHDFIFDFDTARFSRASAVSSIIREPEPLSLSSDTFFERLISKSL
jgi:hypothetical protein